MKRFFLITGAIIMVLSWGAGNTFAEPPSPQPTAKVPKDVDLPVDITIDIIKSGEDIPNSTHIKIDMVNEIAKEKSGKDKEIHLILPRRGGNVDHNGPNDHSVVTSTPAQTGIPDEHGSNPVDFDAGLSHSDHPHAPAVDIPDIDVPGDNAPNLDTPVAIPPDFDTPLADILEPGDMLGGPAPDIKTPVATPPHMDTPVATVPEIEAPGRGSSSLHMPEH